MSWRDAFRPVRMSRLALVAPIDQLRDLLLAVDLQGTVELDAIPPGTPVDEREADSVREAELDRRTRQATVSGPVAGLLGWAPEPAVRPLAERLEPLGAAAVPLPRPRGVQPPTLLRDVRAGRSFDLLVESYTTVPYADVDPTMVAGLAYVAMFGMMFGDVGHGLLLLLISFAVRSERIRRLRSIRRAWPFLAGAGITSIGFGVLYGEFFGPTGLVPAVWLEPMVQPVPLLLAAVGVGAFLVAGAYVLGTVNRVREGGLSFALYAPTGIAGSLLFLALFSLSGGLYFGWVALVVIGIVIALAGLVFAFVGLYVRSTGGGAGVGQAVVELFDLVVRLGSNIVSFARLAAFGLTHAALATIVWQGTTALWQSGGIGPVGAVLVFIAGNAIAFALEALIAGIQALRLEYYELFSRIFDLEGRPFRPWRLPTEPPEVTK